MHACIHACMHVYMHVCMYVFISNVCVSQEDWAQACQHYVFTWAATSHPDLNILNLRQLLNNSPDAVVVSRVDACGAPTQQGSLGQRGAACVDQGVQDEGDMSAGGGGVEVGQSLDVDAAAGLFGHSATVV